MRRLSELIGWPSYFASVRHINVYKRFAPPPDEMIMFFDNRLAQPTRYKRECSNKLVLLNMDCGLFYFDELVTYYAVSCSSDPVVLRWRDSRCAFANLLLARLYIYSGRPLNFPVFIFANVKVILFCWFYCYNFYHADFDRKLIE